MSDGAKSMAELMARHTSSLQTLQKGQLVKGKITKITPSEIMMDVNAKTEALVIEKDRKLLKQLLSMLSVGQEVEATVISAESEMGYPVVSLRKYAEDAFWKGMEELQQRSQKVKALVNEATKGGFVVELENGVSGFLPNSHVGRSEDTQDMVGKTVQVSIIELSRESRKVVVSQKEVLTTEDFAKIAQLYKAGQKVQGVVSGITTFGVFVSLPYEKRGAEQVYVDGLVHISEVSWEKVEDLQERFAMGDEIEAVVIGVDKDGKRVDLSIKRLSADPFAKITEAFPVDKKVTGTVTEVNELGVMVDLGMVEDAQVEGMIKKDKISPNTTYEVGQTVKVTVTGVDARKRKVMLTPVLLEKPLMYR